MKIKLAYTLALFALPVLANTPPEITNVRASQRTDTKLVDIYYDAADADGDLLKVRIEISDNDGIKYSVPAFSLTGDIGEDIAAGKGKHIVWDAGTDWDGEYSDRMRVKVYAIDAQGFPGLEWGNEVPPGGFLMGQDGGAEGSGESRHVNIPWSYWLSKYEITCEQYCDFLNQALAVGFVEKSGTSSVVATTNIPLYMVSKATCMLCEIGDVKDIRWSVNKFEPTYAAASNLPVSVTWYGAISFARFYGYDLPTDAEWEKAARGPDNDDQEEHMCYPWGNAVSSAYANITPEEVLTRVGFYDGNQVPVGPDTVNGYGLYDVIGNVAEWTLSAEGDNASIATYPQEESLAALLHNPYQGSTRIVRGYLGNPIYYRKGSMTEKATMHYLTGYTYSSSYSTIVTPNYQSTQNPLGFRVARRHDVNPVVATLSVKENFDSWSVRDCSNVCFTNATDSGTWIVDGSGYYGARIVSPGVDGSTCVYLSTNCKLWLPMVSGRVVSIRCKVKSTSTSYYFVHLYSVKSRGNPTSTSKTIEDSKYDTHLVGLDADSEAEGYYLSISNGAGYIDDVEIVTTPK